MHLSPTRSALERLFLCRQCEERLSDPDVPTTSAMEIAETRVGRIVAQTAYDSGYELGLRDGASAERVRLEAWATQMRDSVQEQKARWKNGRSRSIQGAEYRRIMSMPLDEVIALHESFQRRRAEA